MRLKFVKFNSQHMTWRESALNDNEIDIHMSSIIMTRTMNMTLLQIHYTDYPNECVLLFRIMQYCKHLTRM